ncbi:MAG: AAA family ATPase [Chloroflexi bacterium]|nr:AAA family ATPase [Chloroflexota bacterium]
MLTLVGPGGVGKTRLAVAAGAELAPLYPDGVVFVDLGPLRDARLVAAAIARALDVRESGGRSARELLLDHLRDRQLVLLLDNFEHLHEAAPLLAELLAGCPRLALLVTSRAALRLRGEQRFAVPPLATPEDPSAPPATIAASPAVQLFVERARAVAPDFTLTEANAATVGRICRRLDGLPLAIELAAARTGLLGPEALLRRLEQRLGPLALLTGGAPDLPERQQTLRRTLAWSHDLLGPAEQVLFRRLAVFAGSWTLEAAEQVCADAGTDLEPAAVLDLLGSLVDKSLVRRRPAASAEARFAMLEAIQAYDLELFERSQEVAAVRRRHAAYYVALGEAAQPQLSGPDHARWMARLGREHDNVRAVLRWALETGELDAGLRLASAIWRFWWLRGYLREGYQWLAELLERSAATGSLRLRAKALNAAGGLADGLGDYARARALYEESLAAARACGDARRVGRALHSLGYLAAELADTARAADWLEACLERARAEHDDALVGVALATAGQVARQQGDLRRAAELLDAGLGCLRRRRNSLWAGAALVEQGHVARQRGDWATAADRYRDALDLFGALGEGYSFGTARCLEGLAAIAAARGHAPRAARLLGAAAALREAVAAPLTPAARPAYDQLRATTQTALGAERFGAAWHAGRALSLADAIALARAGDPEPPPALGKDGDTRGNI